MVLLENKDGKASAASENVDKEQLQQVVTNAIGVREASMLSFHGIYSSKY
jgi:hypothetical protein